MADPKGAWSEYARSDFGGDHARDTHREGLGDDYAREPEPDDRIAEEPHQAEDPTIGKASE